MTNRRRFLALLGIGAASSPLAARELSEQASRSLVGIDSRVLAVSKDVAAYGQGVSPARAQNDPYVQAKNYIHMFGKMPDFVEESLRERCGVTHLDPDIACKKSWSLNVKIMTQRERNFQQQLKRYTEIGTYQAAQSAFEKLTGFQWPW